jgi:hypothetical protein
MVDNQIGTLIIDLSFGHNLYFKYPNGSCKPILDIYVQITFQWYKELFNPISFDPWICPLKIWEFIKTPTPKVGAHLGLWGVHSLTLSYTLRSMKCNSRASLLARTFASPCLGHKPKARVTTETIQVDKPKWKDTLDEKMISHPWDKFCYCLQWWIPLGRNHVQIFECQNLLVFSTPTCFGWCYLVAILNSNLGGGESFTHLVPLALIVNSIFLIPDPNLVPLVWDPFLVSLVRS